MVSDAEWKILGADEMSEELLAQKKHADWMKKNEIAYKAPKKKGKKKKTKRNVKKIIKQEEEDYGIEDEGSEESEEDEADEVAR